MTTSPVAPQQQTKVILVGIGGPTCSGKTTLAKHLRRIIPDSVIIHQDDFAPPQELVPVHPVHKVQDWDAAPGAIQWSRMISFLRDIKKTGEIPPDHRSHDHLNEQKEVRIDEELLERWRAEFTRVQTEAEKNGQKLKFGLVDGFLLYWHPEVVEELDMCAFLRVPYDVLKQRRHVRHGYHTAVQSDPEGSLWRDPPEYWEQIVWPAYMDAHKDMFAGGNVESGEPSASFKGKHFVLMEGLDMSMTEMVEKCCETVRGMVEAADNRTGV